VGGYVRMATCGCIRETKLYDVSKHVLDKIQYFLFYSIIDSCVP